MAISETINIDAGPAIGELREFAAAAKTTAAEVKSAFGDLKVPSLSGSGAGKMASSFDAAAEKISGAVGKIEASLGKLDGLGASTSASLGDLGKIAGDSAAGLAAFADAEKAVADQSARLAKTGVGAGDGIKKTGTSAKESSGWLDEYNATMKASADLQRDLAATSVDSSLAMARGQKIHEEASASLASSSIENDAAMRRSALASKAAQEDSAAASASGAKKHTMLLLGIAGAAAYGIDKAAQLQTSVTRLYTSAGESQKNLPMMTSGILGLSGATNTSQADLGKGAYMVESAGFHGKNALAVLKASAEGAQAEGAPLGEVSNALTSLLNSYGVKKGVPLGQQATSAMNQIMTMVGSGKMTMADAVTALPSVLPTAAKAGLGFGQVGGALATMTATGMSPDRASQMLNHTIGSLQNPNSVQTGEMEQLGLSSTALKKNLGKEGLTGEISQVEGAVLKNMGPAGTVLLKSLNDSKLAAGSARTEIAQMPPELRKVAQGYLDNSVSAKQMRTEIQSLGGEQGNLLKQFQGTANEAHGFNTQLKAGGGDVQTFSSALGKVMGGTVGLQTALMLGGSHMATFQANTDRIAASAKNAGQNIKGWSDIQHTFNFELGSFTKSAEAAATTVGTALLPTATGAVKALAGAGSFLADHPTLTKGLAAGAGILGTSYALQRVASPVATAVRGVGKVAETLHIPGLEKLANIGKGTDMAAGAAGYQRAATTMAEGAAGYQRAADTMAAARGEGVPGGAAGGAARKAEGDAAGAAEGEATAAGMGAKGVAMTGAVGALAALTIVDPMLRSMKSGPGGKNWFENPFGMAGPHDKASSNNWLTSFSPYERLFNQTAAPKTPAGMPSGAPAVTARFGGSAQSAAPPPAPFYGEVPVQAPRMQQAPQLSMGGHPAAATTAQIKIDTSAIDGAKGKVQSAIGGIDQILHGMHPAKLPAPDTSALDSAKGKAQSAANGITQAIESALHKPAKATPPDLSAYSSAAGKARADGAAISAGLAGGILANEGAVVAAASAVASAATAAMSKAIDSHSPSKVTEKEGKNFDAGFVVGLEGGQDAVNAAAAAVGKGAAKAADITSIDSTVKKMLAQVKGDSGLTRTLREDNVKLDQMAKRRADLETEISDSEQTAKAAINGASITNALNATNPAGNEPVSSSAIVTGQGYQASTMKQYAAALMKLQKEGLNATSLSQYAQADPTANLSAVQGLASGGKAAIRQLNQLQKQMQSSAAQIGNVAGPAMVQAGKDMGDGLATSLKSTLGKLDKDMNKLAGQMVADVSKHGKNAKAAATKAASSAAGSSSAGNSAGSSQAGSDGSGKSALTSAASALSGSAAALSGAAGALTSAASSLKNGGGKASTSTSHPVAHPVAAGAGAGGVSGRIAGGQAPAGYGGYGGLGGRGGGGGVTIHNTTHVTVQGSVTTHDDLATSLTGIIQTRAANNWQSPLRTPGRPS